MDQTLWKFKNIWKIIILVVWGSVRSWGRWFFLYKSIRENQWEIVVFRVIFVFEKTPRPPKLRFFKNSKRFVKYSPWTARKRDFRSRGALGRKQRTFELIYPPLIRSFQITAFIWLVSAEHVPKCIKRRHFSSFTWPFKSALRGLHIARNVLKT